MGREMALNLLKAGFAVCAYDVRKEAIDDLVAQGATGAQSPADAARDADIIISMLPDTPQVEEIVYGEGGLLSAPATRPASRRYEHDLPRCRPPHAC